MALLRDTITSWLTLREQSSAPTAPATAGDQALYVRTSDHHLVREDSNGTVVDLEWTRDANGGSWERGYASEEITLSTSGTTTDSSANLLPAGAVIEAVTARVTTTITTATDWSVGDATTAARFISANSTLTSGTTAVGLNHRKGGVSTDATGPTQAAAAKVRITTTGTPGAGKIRVTVFYSAFVAPTS